MLRIAAISGSRGDSAKRSNWEALPHLKQTIPTGVSAGSVAASRSGALLWVTETVLLELLRSDWPAGIFQRDDSRRRLPSELARAAQAISRLLV
jgi:hypothetical protein